MLVVFSSNEDSGESAQLRRLARGFNARIYKVGMMLEAQTNVNP